MGIARNINELKQRIAAAALRAGRSADEITLIAVTKTAAVPDIQKAIEAGIGHFGESRIQEAESKILQLNAAGLRPTWHMIGHLQRNKVKTALEIFDIIHSIDSLRLAQTVSIQAKENISILIQVNIAEEETKQGFSIAEAADAAREISSLPNLSIRGLMTIAPMVDDAEGVRPVFRELRQLRDSLGLEHLSMGMSNDFEIAIEEGATMVRVGRAIFGL